MKVTDHVEHLLRQGRKPAELVELGFPKPVVTRARRQLRQEKILLQPKAPKGRAAAKGDSQASAWSSVETASIQQKLVSLESQIRELETRVEALEVLGADLEDIEARLDGTPALRLKHSLACDCGASGFVALRTQCTKCGREMWSGWLPKQ